MTKDIIAKIKLLFSWTKHHRKIKSGTISYDYCNSIDSRTKRKLEVCKHKYEKKNPDKNADKFMRLFVKDTRGEKTPWVTIHFNQKILRKEYETKMPKNLFGWYHINSLTTTTLTIKDGEVKETQGSMNFRVNPDWHVEYIVEKNPKDKKIIAGFDCIKFNIKEIKTIKGKSIKRRNFELYATNKIKLPAHAVCLWYDKVIKECPLEIKVNTQNKEGGYWLRVRSISGKPPTSALEIPQRFKQ